MVVNRNLVITAEGDSGVFDQEIIHNWKAEGFNVSYLPFAKTTTKQEYIAALHHHREPLGVGEKYAIVGLPPSTRALLAQCLN